jgi:hypothetical protein
MPYDKERYQRGMMLHGGPGPATMPTDRKASIRKGMYNHSADRSRKAASSRKSGG